MCEATPGLVGQRLERFVALCRRKGLKITPQRLEIFRELASTADHPTADQLFERVRTRMPTISLDTVYRTLATLQEYGLIRRVEALDDQGRYDANLARHHHFICTRCRKVHDFYWPSLDRLEPPEEGRKLGEIRQVRAELLGICRACREEAE